MSRKSMADMVRQRRPQETEARERESAGAVEGAGEEANRGTAPSLAAASGVERRRSEGVEGRRTARNAAMGAMGDRAEATTDGSDARAKINDGDSSGGPTGEQGGAEGEPKYLSMQRIDGRVRPDQYIELVRIAQQMNRRWKGGERTTPNTLVRIGIDLLIAQEDQLAGATELELRESVGVGTD